MSDLFILTLVPNLIGSMLRVPYAFAIPRLGGRAWTTISTGILLVPALLLAVLVPSGWLASQSSGTQFWVLLACAATAGVGGANFASSMANISFFYPERKKGVLIQVILRQASLGISALEKAATTPAAKVAIANSHSTWSVPALWVFIGAYVVLGGVTWFAYLRSPAPADASLAGVLS
ncbi:MAG: hypothetical protein ACRDX8_02975 [Acidimicrobiales bacterium]